MRGAFAESSLRKQAWRNPKEGRVVCLHQNIFTRKVTHLPSTFARIIHILRPPRPRAPYLMSLSPSSRVPKSQVPTHASRCPRPLVPVPLFYTAKRKKIKTASEHKSSPQVPAAGAIFRFSRMRAWGRVALPMNKMASHRRPRRSMCH